MFLLFLSNNFHNISLLRQLRTVVWSELPNKMYSHTRIQWALITPVCRWALARLHLLLNNLVCIIIITHLTLIEFILSNFLSLLPASPQEKDHIIRTITPARPPIQNTVRNTFYLWRVRIPYKISKTFATSKMSRRKNNQLINHRQTDLYISHQNTPHLSQCENHFRNHPWKPLRKDFVILQLYWWPFSSTKTLQSYFPSYNYQQDTSTYYDCWITLQTAFKIAASNLYCKITLVWLDSSLRAPSLNLAVGIVSTPSEPHGLPGRRGAGKMTSL